MIEIDARVKYDSVEVGDFKLNMTNAEFEDFIKKLVKINDSLKTGVIQFRDDNGNYGTNFNPTLGYLSENGQEM